jgi:hypothetical protein
MHSYRAHLVPPDTDPAEIETMADANLLPTIQLRAVNATKATENACRISGKKVFRVDRLESA